MFHHFLNSATNYLHHHPQMGMLFAFIVAFLESLPIVGTIVPGSITMTAVGAMIGAGLIPGYLTLSIASLGAFIGDVVGFATGRIFKDRLRDVWPFRKHPKIISLSEEFIGKHGGKSILIGRFVGAVRSAVPMVAGLLHLSWIRFMLAALPTAILWAIVYSLPGIILGAFSMEIPPKLLTEYIVFGVAIIIVLWGLYWLIQRFFSSISQYYHRQIDRCWGFLQHHHGSQWLIKLITNQQAPNCHHQLSRLVLAGCSFILFLIILINLLLHSSLMLINAPVFSLAQSLRIYHLTPLFITFSLFGKTTMVMLIAFVLSFLLLCCRQWRASAHLCFGTILTIAVVYLIKTGFHNPRPDGFVIVAKSSSFPSGHVALSLFVYGLLAFFTAQYFKENRGIIYTVAGIVIALIAASRLYLGAHWLLDVCGSLLLSTTLLLLTQISYKRLPKPTSALCLNRWAWLTMMLIVVIGVWAGNVYVGYHTAMLRYTPYQKRIETSLDDWWQHPHNFAPTFRKNRFGHPAQPLNLQWAGTLPQIKTTLLTNGWHVITRQHHIEDTVHRLASDKAQYHLPLFEMLYNNKRPSLIMYKSIPHQSSIYILRLWDAHVHFNPHQKLWVGMVNKLAAPNAFITFMHHNLMSFAKMNIGVLLYGNDLAWQAKYTLIPAQKIPSRLRGYDWDRRVWQVR